MRLVVRAWSSDINDILTSYDVSLEETLRLNKMDVTAVKEGMLITIDTKDDIEYIAKPFDTIEKIASIYNVTPQYIREYNGIDKVFLGDKIYIER